MHQTLSSTLKICKHEFTSFNYVAKSKQTSTKTYIFVGVGSVEPLLSEWSGTYVKFTHCMELKYGCYSWGQAPYFNGSTSLDVLIQNVFVTD